MGYIRKAKSTSYSHMKFIFQCRIPKAETRTSFLIKEVSCMQGSFTWITYIQLCNIQIAVWQLLTSHGVPLSFLEANFWVINITLFLCLRMVSIISAGPGTKLGNLIVFHPTVQQHFHRWGESIHFETNKEFISSLLPSWLQELQLWPDHISLWKQEQLERSNTWRKMESISHPLCSSSYSFIQASGLGKLAWVNLFPLFTPWQSHFLSPIYG